jgi:hypothetical protein
MPRNIPKAIRAEVYNRAEGRCEYCRIPEGYAIYAHQIDLIIAKQHGVDDQISNLALACFSCNSKKGSNIASYDFSSQQLVQLYHPRIEQWNHHFIYRDGVISGITITGKVTALLLDFNDSRQIETRRNVEALGFSWVS